jgi:acetolactate synthase-1/2/3 large subunit
MNSINGAQCIIRFLEQQGVRVVAGIPGGANLPLYDALADSTQILHVLARHEQGAAFIAQGMARANGRPGVCLATSGPGATNLLTAIADAWMDSVPLICLTGQVPRSLLGTRAFQEIDICALARPITKGCFLVRAAADLPSVLDTAFRLAASGRPGPVLIDVPKDVQLERAASTDLSGPGSDRRAETPAADPTTLAKAAEMINRTKRPMLYLGGGVVQAGAATQARCLAERGSLPTVLTLMGLGVLPAGHPLSLGLLGMHGNRATNLAMAECDLLIAAGVRFDDRATGLLAEFCPRASVIHLDIDQEEIGRLRQVELGIRADAGQALAALASAIERRDRAVWLERIQQLRLDHPGFQDQAFANGRPFGLIRTIAGLVGPDALVATDVGKHQMWVAQSYPFNRPRQLLTSGGLGTMGFGLPAAIGASLACPNQRVVCFSGDGSLQMNIQELATVVEQNANVTIVCMDNHSLGLVRQQQRLFYGNRPFASSYGVAADFAAIARGFGLRAVRLDEPADEWPGQLGQILREPGPCLIHVPIARDEEVYPMVPPGAANTVMIGEEDKIEMGVEDCITT